MNKPLVIEVYEAKEPSQAKARGLDREILRGELPDRTTTPI